MRNIFVAVSIGLAALAIQVGHADVLIPVPPIPGSIFTLAFAINDNNVVTGYFDGSDGKVHGFYESLDGSSYTIFDDDSGVVAPLAIDDAGTIAGETIVTDQSTCDVIPFERAPDGTIAHVTRGKKSLTGVVSGLNNKGAFVGYFCDKNGGISSYYGKRGKYNAPLTIFGLPLNTLATGINKSGMVAGYFTSGQETGFVLSNGVTTFVQHPGAVSTVLTDINDHGIAVGTATDAQSETRAFVFDTSSQTIQDVDVFTGVQTYGMNNRGLLIILVPNSFASFVFCPGPKKKCPGNGAEIKPGQTLPAPPLDAALLRHPIPEFLRPAPLPLQRR
jgi:hypothetical protein